MEAASDTTEEEHEDSFTEERKSKKEEEERESPEDEIRRNLKGIINEDGEHYNIRIENEEDGSWRNAVGIPRVKHLEQMSVTLGNMWPVQVYCGMRTVELDPVVREKGKIEDLLKRLTNVLLGFLKNYPWIGLDDVEKILRYGNCDSYIVAQRPPRAGPLKAIIHNGKGEECEWFYDLAYGAPLQIWQVYQEFGCESTRQNMERLEKAGHITFNYDEFRAARAKMSREMFTKSMSKDK